MRTYYHLKNWRAVQMLYAKHSFDQAVRSWLVGRSSALMKYWPAR